ncbi:MAG: CHAP domain-containing protein [Acidimicrobiales bacterium]
MSSSTDPPPVRYPPWWSGPCDDGHYPGSFELSSWDGLAACGPGPNRGGYDASVEFFPGAWGELEWECVELSMRWLYLEYGVRPYPADGSGVVWNYSRADGGDLYKVANDGTSVPRPGDVLSMGSEWADGHTAVVTGVNLSHGYGTITILEQNMNGGNGTNTLAVFKNYVEPDYGMAITGWLQAATPAVMTADDAASRLPAADLVLDGGFNHRGLGAWHKTSHSHVGIEMARAITTKQATAPYEGYGFAVTRSSAPGAGIYQDIPFPVSSGDSFCADAEVVTAGEDSGAVGTMSLWLLGGSQSQSSKAHFGPLRGRNQWTPVSSCLTATSAHSDIRIQFYDAPHTPQLGIDAVDVHQSFVLNGGFDHHVGTGWQIAKHSWLGIESAGSLGTMPYGGNGFAVTNTTASSGGIYQDVPLSIRAGDTLCADAEVVTAGAHSGARGNMALSLVGRSRPQLSSVNFAKLPGRSRWTAISTCVTATGPHTGFRIQFDSARRAPTLGIDGVDVHQSFVENGGFNNHGSAGWHKAGNTWFESEAAGKLSTSAYEGNEFGATSTSVRGGGIYQVVSLPISAGESLCADAQVVTAGVRAGAEGEMALSLLGKSPSQASSVPFGPLPAQGRWTPVSTCVTSAGPHSGFRIEFFDIPHTPALGIDAVDVR